MSTQDNIEYIKSELNSQEKLFKGLFHFEQFYRKRQKAIISLLIIISIGVIGFFIKSSIDEGNNIKANIAFNNLMVNMNSKEDEDILKKYNSELFDIYRFKKSMSSEDIKNETFLVKDMPILKDLFEYQKAISSKDLALLDSYSLKQSSSLKDFALLSEILLLIQENKISEAKEKLAFVSPTSALTNFSNLIKHYLITK